MAMLVDGYSLQLHMTYRLMLDVWSSPTLSLHGSPLTPSRLARRFRCKVMLMVLLLIKVDPCIALLQKRCAI